MEIVDDLPEALLAHGSTQIHGSHSCQLQITWNFETE